MGNPTLKGKNSDSKTSDPRDDSEAMIACDKDGAAWNNATDHSRSIRGSDRNNVTANRKEATRPSGPKPSDHGRLKSNDPIPKKSQANDKSDKNISNAWSNKKKYREGNDEELYVQTGFLTDELAQLQEKEMERYIKKEEKRKKQRS